MTENQPTGEPSRDPTLTQLPGVNPETGLSIARNNEAIYRRLLIKFRESWSDYRRSFDEALDDSHATGHLAHNLKGVAANLGIELVQQLAGELELICRDSDASKSQREDSCQRLFAELERVMLGLQSLD